MKIPKTEKGWLRLLIVLYIIGYAILLAVLAIIFKAIFG